MKDSRISFFFYFIITFILLSLQSTQFISIANVYPDFIMILTIIYAFFFGPMVGMLSGFFLGLLLDVMSGVLFGLDSFVFTLLGSCVFLFQRTVKFPYIISLIFYLILSTIIKYMLYALFYWMFDHTNIVDPGFVLKIFSEMILNVIFGVVLYILVAHISHREYHD